MWVQRGLILLACLQTTWTQINELTPVAMMPQITSLKVQCEKTGMIVSVEFDRPFNGIIYSKGYYSSPGCRYVAIGSNRSYFDFTIPINGCGTQSTEVGGRLKFDNTVIFQTDLLVQELGDKAKMISCDWQSLLDKLVTFRPFMVNMLEAERIEILGDSVECWMEIQIGEGPFAPIVNGIVRIGDKMSVVVYVRDKGAGYDARVKDCYAYDNSDFHSSDTSRVQLTNVQGCPIKPTLFSQFLKTLDTRDTGADLIAFATMRAFKFPQTMNVYITCKVEICRTPCQTFCDDFPSETISFGEKASEQRQVTTTTLPLFNPRDILTTVNTTITTLPTMVPTSTQPFTNTPTDTDVTTVSTTQQLLDARSFQREETKANRYARDLRQPGNFSLNLSRSFTVVSSEDLPEYEATIENQGLIPSRKDGDCISYVVFAVGISILGFLLLSSLLLAVVLCIRLRVSKEGMMLAGPLYVTRK
ncbi:uncharacterized protein LOC143247342 isoform X2 [Tachypleus tridentatus]|uniref:uncharacterized protein LOC143247342 isoform X2 n=1 Tax=Tachypleus tridentatus TaxID=6853 RepID=UPI003FD46D0E